MSENRPLTGYPSIDKPWLKYYKPDVEERALSTPMDKTFYRFYKENVFTDPDFPILEYFNASFTTKKFLAMIEIWARAFRAVGVTEDEMVPVYGTWCPEIAAIFFALNAIGAYPYFEKLEITENALRVETEGARVAVIFEPLWNDVAKKVFSEDRFRKVFIIGLADSMRFPLKQLVQLKGGNLKRKFANTDKFILMDQIKKLASEYSASFEVPFKKGRIAIATTSSGTTSSVVKGIMDTNEGALANVLGTAYSEPGFISGKKCLITLPPTASTAINCFFLLPLYMGMTVRIDPRADEESWPKLLLRYRPSLTATTGSLWLSFFRKMENLHKKGKKIDLSFLDTFILGGSGVTPEQLAFINQMAKKCRIPSQMDSGYGCSEFFG
ncbi:MAG: AMP-binding protein, partial [Clostridia bacterium]|nr:AMP-binding protein [Clostridia bacterium]